MKAMIENGMLTIIIPITKKISSTGKSILIASETDKSLTFEGKPVTISINAHVPAQTTK